MKVKDIYDRKFIVVSLHYFYIYTKTYQNWYRFGQVIAETKRCTFTHMV